METLLPIVFVTLSDDVLKPSIEVNKFFKNLRSTTLREDVIEEMHQNITIIVCKLDTIFPPGFFNVMEHLSIHLAEEALLSGLV